jgi:hypothetical protein
LIFVDAKGLPVETALRKATRPVSEALRRVEESKAEGVSKGSWQAIECDEKWRSI